MTNPFWARRKNFGEKVVGRDLGGHFPVKKMRETCMLADSERLDEFEFPS